MGHYRCVGKTMKLIEIAPRIYLRGNLSRVQNLSESLQAAGIDVVVRLVTPNIAVTGVTFIYFPIADGRLRAETTESLEKLADDLFGYWQQGKRIVITCNMGRNRAALLTTLVVSRALKLSYSDSMALVRARRPNALANKHFERYIIERSTLWKTQ